ncbi:hypothetical protein X777_03950 [Ooceraea biroi]|uniref:Uncharacterized protein n=1 Tax=Ooceraea biroi TaxID=2015173 RepID=A0A026WJC7_OOCBI|nr:hypothetical protein X777_03950 [Ooceraea biroi]
MLMRRRILCRPIIMSSLLWKSRIDRR